MAVVTFGELVCVKQEDWNGKDDIYITINGKQVYSTRIGEGGKRSINKAFPYEGDVARVRMYESDDLGDDDLLGEQIPLLGHGEMKFTEDDAHYTLTYELTVK
ncbi:hypothetical protein AB0D04_14225 [Streptomyces sp. NPDC048483]|uniref:hypothetical protein n=1 Tax=Streptomyces sp. NPDC048483 TaxID=3154927 RepID=UPI00343F12F9